MTNICVPWSMLGGLNREQVMQFVHFKIPVNAPLSDFGKNIVYQS